MTDKEKEVLLKWALILRNLSDFVQIERINGIKFEVRTNEQSGHHRPHLHVSTSSANMSIAIDDFEILACSGKISPVQKRMAREWMQENKDLLIEKWNQFSNGIQIPVD